mgnify:FL=1
MDIKKEHRIQVCNMSYDEPEVSTILDLKSQMKHIDFYVDRGQLRCDPSDSSYTYEAYFVHSLLGHAQIILKQEPLGDGPLKQILQYYTIADVIKFTITSNEIGFYLNPNFGVLLFLAERHPSRYTQKIMVRELIRHCGLFCLNQPHTQLDLLTKQRIKSAANALGIWT